MTGLQIEWPSGQDYWDWTGEDPFTPRSWVSYKLSSAKWHIAVLKQLGERLNGFPRDIGVEMSLDGALGAISGAFDASVAALIRACEESDAQAVRDNSSLVARKPLEAYLYKWDRAKSAYAISYRKLRTVDVPKIFDEVDKALDRAGTPIGWLEEVRRLRNRTTHQETLARHMDTNVGQGTRLAITVDHAGVDPVAYLTGVTEKVATLTDSLLGISEALCPNGMPSSIPVLNATVRPKSVVGTASIPSVFPAP